MNRVLKGGIARSQSSGNDECGNSNGSDEFVEQPSDIIVSENKAERKVLVLYTGGTIGMVRNEDGALTPKSNAFINNLKKYPNMHDMNYMKERFGEHGSFALPISGTDNRRIIYDVVEYSPLCDSSNMSMSDWIRIATDIQNSYQHFDGFVVLHGTDTLSYTASALSFILEALGKIVVITGSQIPIFDARNDGLNNFQSSLLIAADCNIPEVCVFFGNQLMRGNRTSKISTTDFDAFHSPNFPPLAEVGIKIDVNYRSIFRSNILDKFRIHTTLNRNVSLLRLFPNITADLVKALLQPPIEGMILQSYGCGNVPSNREDIINELRAAVDRGVIIVNITQCAKGSVSSIYETGNVLINAGIILGYDMTVEAALTKLSYVLSKTEWDVKTKCRMMQTNLRGELTAGRPPSRHEWDFLDVVAQAMHVNSPNEIRELGAILFPAMLHSAAITRDTAKLDLLKEYGADISQQNADGRTALHVACCEGSLSTVRHLLLMGANVHVKDRFGRTPMIDAIDHDKHDIIKLLRQCGAHLYNPSHVIGGRMCVAAAVGNTNHLHSYYLAGANLSQEDVSGRTPLHLAALTNHSLTARFLLEHGADPTSEDVLGQTPYNLAVSANATDCIRLLSGIKKGQS